MIKRNSLLILLLIVVSVVEIVGRFIDSIEMEYASMPLIMILIAIIFLVNVRKKSIVPWVLLAFFFSWAGDMLLMFSGAYNNESYFYAGVGAFFLAQITYIFVLLFSAENSIKGFLIRRFFWSIPLIAYGVLIYLMLFPKLDGIMVYLVLLYTVAITGMSLAALNRKDRVGLLSYRLVMTGAVVFIISDSLLAINKFHTEILYGGALSMATYIIAQYLIMRGLAVEK